jgi:hypothetical protein
MNVTSLFKISATGIQDERLTSPQPSLDAIKAVIPKRGRYTTRYERIEFETTPQFGQQATAEIPVKGHLLRSLYLVINLPDIYTPQEEAKAESGQNNFIGPTFGWVNSAGHAIVEEATIDIGGKPIDRLDSRLLEVLDEFNTPLEKLRTQNKLIMRNMTNFTTDSFKGQTQLTIPLPFWFTRDPALALPVDAINVDTIRLRVQLRALSEMFYTDSRNLTTDPISLWPMQGSKFYKKGSTIQKPQGLATNESSVTALKTQMPTTFKLADTYLIGEYIYLDKYEANRFRIGDIEIPIIQHYALPIIDTQGAPRINAEVNIPNPTRALYWIAQRQEAAALNAHFYASRDISATNLSWPDASPLTSSYHPPIPAWRFQGGGDPFTGFALTYDGYVRTRTEAPQLYRSILPSLEHTKSPYVNRYYYTISLSDQKAPPSAPHGEANLDKIQRRTFYAEMSKPGAAYNVYMWGETFNVLKIYGGRAGLLFSY